MQKYLARNWGKLLTYFFLLLGVYVMVVPFAWMIFTSFKTYSEAMQVPIKWLPETLNLENYQQILSMNIGRYYVNTIIITIAITVSQLITASMAAYAFARIDFPLKNAIFALVLCMLMIPSQMTLIPKYAMCNNLGLVNSLWGIIVPNMFSVTVTFFLRQAFLTLPTELEDAARIDGCSHLRIYLKIALPLSTSILVAMGILTVLYAWNDLLWPIIVTSSDKSRVLSVFIAAIKGEHNNKLPLLMAGGTLSVMPMIVCFILGQKYFVTAITMTGLKD